MGFKGLTDRYEATYKDLYRLPVKTAGTDEPFLSFRPDDPKRTQTESDSPTFFPGTIERESLRLARYLKSHRGMNFILRQAELQAGNTFSETRIFNPLFVGSLIVPFTHIKRPLDSAYGHSLSGDGKSPASDDAMGSAGRLQIATRDKSISGLMNVRGNSGLLNIIAPGNPLSRAVSGIMNATSGKGITGVDGRPELSIGGEYFSVAQWRGFKSSGKQGDPLNKVKSKLLSGDLSGAKDALFGAGNSVLRNIIGPITNVKNTFAGTTSDRGQTKSGTQFDGMRYFVTHGPDDESVDRYVRDYPVSNKIRLNPPRTPATGDALQRATNFIQKTKHDVNDILRSVSRVGSFLFGSSAPAITSKFDKLTSQTIAAVDPSEKNPGQAHMIYPDLSLQSRYTDGEQIETDLDSQIQHYKLTYTPDNIGKKGTAEARVYGTAKRLAGFEGGLKPNYQENESLTPTRWEQAFRAGSADSLAPSYVISDPMNRIQATFDNEGDEISTDVMKNIRDASGNLIDFLFYDFGSSTVLPFRAMLTDINESTTPNWQEQQYIGRIERNIVYVGVIREVSFAFRIQAFSKVEMDNVWTKINYLTGLSYPSSYSNGFLVPPLVKLTIGNVYKDQPGYIKSMTYKMDDDDWEIDEDNQVPMGVTVNMSFSIIEKQQMSTGTDFYDYPTSFKGSSTSGQSSVTSQAQQLVGGPQDILAKNPVPDISRQLSNLGGFGFG
jgi:hypothetical protein